MVMVLLGGMGSLFGPVLGAAVYLLAKVHRPAEGTARGSARTYPQVLLALSARPIRVEQKCQTVDGKRWVAVIAAAVDG